MRLADLGYLDKAAQYVRSTQEEVGYGGVVSGRDGRVTNESHGCGQLPAA